MTNAAKLTRKNHQGETVARYRGFANGVWFGCWMAPRHLGAVWLGLIVLLAAGCATMSEQRSRDRTLHDLLAQPLAPVADEAQLRAYVASQKTLTNQLHRQYRNLQCERGLRQYCPRAQQERCRDCLDRVEVVGSQINAADVITNNQETGVDEGDIVKKSGSFLYVLREDWLRVVDTGSPSDPRLSLIQSLRVADDPTGETVWYDEILAYPGRLVLVGFNYQEDVAELLSYAIAANGELSLDGRYWLRVEDYFSASNYGSRIEGGNLLLILAMPLDPDLTRAWPVWSRRDVPNPTWQSLVDVDDIHLPVAVAIDPVVHLVLRCPLEGLAGDALDCDTVGIVGERESESYVTRDAVYLAVTHWTEEALRDPRFDVLAARWFDVEELDFEHEEFTVIYRIPFAGNTRVEYGLFDGVPGTQFTFKADGEAFYAAMRENRRAEGNRLVLQRLAMKDFSDDPFLRPRAGIVTSLDLDAAHLTYRFVDDWVLIGANSQVLQEERRRDPKTWQGHEVPMRTPPPVQAISLVDGRIQQVPMPHTGDQIDPVANGIVVSGIGPDGGWRISVLDRERMSGPTIDIRGRWPNEKRSHAFNHTLWRTGAALMGWPVTRPEAGVSPDDPTWRTFQEESVSDFLLVHWHDGRVRIADIIDMQPDQAPPSCEPSWTCFSWYGNARVFFFDDRIFALSGPRIAEAQWINERMQALRVLEFP